MAARSSSSSDVFPLNPAEAISDMARGAPEREEISTLRFRTSRNVIPTRRTIRRSELRQIVPVADTTIYEMEQRGEFPRRFNLTPRCVVWDLAEVEAWIDERRLASDAAVNKRAPAPDVRQRKTRPVRA
jgi:prophage regulatory protein